MWLFSRPSGTNGLWIQQGDGEVWWSDMVLKDLSVASDITMFASLISHWAIVYLFILVESPFRRTHLALHFWTKLCSVCYIPPVYPSWYTHYGWSCTTIFVGPLSCRSYRCIWVCTWSLIYTWEISWDLIAYLDLFSLSGRIWVFLSGANSNFLWFGGDSLAALRACRQLAEVWLMRKVVEVSGFRDGLYMVLVVPVWCFPRFSRGALNSNCLKVNVCKLQSMKLCLSPSWNFKTSS